MTTYIVSGCKQSTHYTFNVYKAENLLEDELSALMANPRPGLNSTSSSYVTLFSRCCPYLCQQ